LDRLSHFARCLGCDFGDLAVGHVGQTSEDILQMEMSGALSAATVVSANESKGFFKETVKVWRVKGGSSRHFQEMTSFQISCR
jgi:hypothetical protein